MNNLIIATERGGKPVRVSLVIEGDEADVVIDGGTEETFHVVGTTCLQGAAFMERLRTGADKSGVLNRFLADHEAVDAA